MRSILYVVPVVALVLIAAGVAPASEIRDQQIDQAALILEVDRSPGTLHLVLSEPSATPFSRPQFRLIALPAGAVDPQVRLPATAAGVEVHAGEPMILRGVKVLPVLITPGPDTDGPRGVTASGRIEIEIDYRQEPVASPVSNARAHSRGFYAPYRDHFPDNERHELLTATEGSYLIVTAPQFQADMETFAAWKRELGYDVSLVTTSETGASREAIQSYVRNLYHQATVPPQYLLLVGDVEQMATFDYHGSVSDLPYALLDGDDFLPDLEVGRLSARNLTELQTILAKILRHEQDPYMGTGESWFSRGLVVAADYGSTTPVPVSRWCREQLLEVGYAAVDSVHYPGDRGPLATMKVTDTVNAGVSLVSYRGFAYGWQGWHSPRYTVDHVGALQNGWMLPTVFSFVCLNNNFREPECFGEAWVRAGTATAPQGAVAFIGNSESWSHTRFNDAAAIGTFRALREQGVRRLGGLLNAAKFGILEQFPDRLDYAAFQDESVEFNFYIYSLLGDPAMEIWTAAPRTITVQHADSIPQGSNLLEVVVLEESGTTPVAGARVAVSQGSTVLGRAWTDDAGLVRILADFDQVGTPVQITVTGQGVAPYRRSLDIVTDAPYLAYAGVTIDDGGDGMPNPGETLALRLDLYNHGAMTATNVSATLTAVRGAVVETAGVTFPDIAPDSEASSIGTCVVSIAADAEDGLRAEFRLTVDAGGQESVDGFDLEVRAPALRFKSYDVVGEEAVLEPGEQASLDVTLENAGSINASATEVVLRSVVPSIATVIDSARTLPALAVGSSGKPPAPFTIEVDAEAAIGQAAVFTLAMTTAEGYVSETSFSIVIGTVDRRAPLGPDAYGYYAYDNADTDYPDTAPAYDWITCSTAYGGAGDTLKLTNNTTMKVTLPFAFPFYGETYRELLISDNGWASFDTTVAYDFYNWRLPNSYGNGALLAVFWDNLDPTKEVNDVLVGDGIYVLDDQENRRYVVEWSHLGNSRIYNGEHPTYDDLQTFQLILYDPAYRAGAGGQGVIRYQYKHVVNNDFARMYATVGIENFTEDIALEYTYANTYPGAAAPLTDGLAIEFTTTPPRYSPFRLRDFRATPTAAGVLLAWEPADDRPRGAYRVYRAPAGTQAPASYALVTDGIWQESGLGFLDTGADPAAAHSYRLGSFDRVGHETLLGPYAYASQATPRLRLGLAPSGPNPFRGGTFLTYSLPARTTARLSVYSVSGRLVRTLVEKTTGPGVWIADWNGRDDQGGDLPSGIYFGRLDTGNEQRAVKLTLVR